MTREELEALRVRLSRYEQACSRVRDLEHTVLTAFLGAYHPPQPQALVEAYKERLASRRDIEATFAVKR